MSRFVLFVVAVILVVFLVTYVVYYFQKDRDKKVWKYLSYWITSIIMSFLVFFILSAAFAFLMFHIWDYRDYSIEYGEQVLSAYNDGLMGSDWFRVYDNNTFEAQYWNIVTNGTCEIIGDTVFVKQNDKYHLDEIPLYFLIEGNGVEGYFMEGDSIHSNLYMGIYFNVLYP